MIKKFALALAAVLLLALAVGFVLPRTWRVEREVLINAEPGRVHALLFDLKRWQEWSVWTRAMDPQLRNTYEGPQEGVGAKWMWLGPKMGRGRMVIVASDPLRGIELEQAIESDEVNARASLSLSREGAGTRLIWIDEGTLPFLVGGFFRGTVERQLGEHLAASLEKLRALAEAPRG